MEKLDYNGLYEYLYEMENQEAFPEEAYREGIPKEEFESLIMAYLPVSAEQLRKYAAFDPEKQVYPWIPVRGGSYVLSFFETSLPEVAEIKENGGWNADADGMRGVRYGDLQRCADHL